MSGFIYVSNNNFIVSYIPYLLSILFNIPLFRVPPERPIGQPGSSGPSHLIYHRPGHLGGVPTIPVPKPTSPNFVYGHGYTTYINPFNLLQRVPQFNPTRYQMANSFQDLFVTVSRDLLRKWNLLVRHGRPRFWFSGLQ